MVARQVPPISSPVLIFLSVTLEGTSQVRRRVDLLRILSPMLFVAAAVIVLLLGIWIFQRRLIYFPYPSHLETPAVLSFEPVSLRTGDGLELGAWFVAAPGATNGATVVVFNGNAGNRSHRAPLADALSRAGFSVLVFDYRGYGGNPGRPSERGLLEDARSAREYLLSRDDVDPERIVYFGESLGAAVAIGLAAHHPPAALVLRSPFPSLAAVGRRHYPFLPVSLLLRDRYPSIERIADLPSPVLVVVGDRDSIVSPTLSRQLFDAASEPKRWLSIPGADHNDWELLAGTTLVSAVINFVEEHAR